MRKICIGRVLLFSVLHFALSFIFFLRVESEVWGASYSYQLQQGQYLTHLLPEAVLSLPMTIMHDEFSDPCAEERKRGYCPVVGAVKRTEEALIPALEPHSWWLNSLIWGFCAERWFNVLASFRRGCKITLFRRGVN